MKQAIYELYKQCFPNYYTSIETFLSKLNLEESTILTHMDGSTLVGFSIVHQNAVHLLCVKEEYRNNGIGTTLVNQSLSKIKEAGFTSASLGPSNTFLYPGIPEYQGEHSLSFFQRFGFESKKTSVDMILELETFDINSLTIPQADASIFYCYATKEDWEELLYCVEQVDESWVPYFLDQSARILIAKIDGNIAGFAHVSCRPKEYINAVLRQVGDVGCVGVIPKYRNLGIGRKIVAYGTSELKNLGCEIAYIAFTYFEQWYSLLGFQTYLRFHMNEVFFD